MHHHDEAPPARTASVGRGVFYAGAALSVTVAFGAMALGGGVVSLALGAVGLAVGLAAASTSPGLGGVDVGILTVAAFACLVIGTLAFSLLTGGI